MEQPASRSIEKLRRLECRRMLADDLLHLLGIGKKGAGNVGRFHAGVHTITRYVGIGKKRFEGFWREVKTGWRGRMAAQISLKLLGKLVWIVRYGPSIQFHQDGVLLEAGEGGSRIRLDVNHVITVLVF